MRILSPFLCAVAVVLALVPDTAISEADCERRFVWLSTKSLTVKRKLPDGAEVTETEYGVGVCVDPKVRDEIVASMRRTGKLTEEGLGELIAAIRSGRSAVRYVVAKSGDLGSGAADMGKAATATTAELSRAALQILSASAQWTLDLASSRANAAAPATD